MLFMDEKLYRYHFRIFLSTKRSLSEEERSSLKNILTEAIEKRGYEIKKVAVYRNSALLDFAGGKEIDSEKFVKATEKAIGFSIWENYRVQKTLEIDGKKLI